MSAGEPDVAPFRARERWRISPRTAEAGGSGRFVPINIRSDGFWGVLVRVGATDDPAILTEREVRYRMATSRPYLFRSAGQPRLSGIEHVEAEPPPERLRFGLPPGPYSVEVTIIAWGDEPRNTLADGSPRVAPSGRDNLAELSPPRHPGGRDRPDKDEAGSQRLCPRGRRRPIDGAPPA